MSYNPLLDGPPYLSDSAVVKLASRVAVRYTSKVSTRNFFATLAPETVTMLEAALTSLMADNGGAPYSELTALLSFLRALSVIHQTHHWQTRGPQSYSDHLMFERLYNGAVEGIDSIAERAVGSGERLLVRPMMQVSQLERLMNVIYSFAAVDPTTTEYVQLSLNAELAFMAFANLAVESMKAKGLLSRGVDNLVAGIQDRHETHIYLLRQRLSE